jgi:hypothetical protein
MRALPPRERVWRTSIHGLSTNRRFLWTTFDRMWGTRLQWQLHYRQLRARNARNGGLRMSHLRTIGLSVAIVGTIGGGLLSLMKVGRHRRLTAAEIDAMDDDEFGRHIDEIGLGAQVRDALARLGRGER